MRGGKSDVAARLLPVELVGTSPHGALGGLSQAVAMRVEWANGRRIVVEEGFSASIVEECGCGAGGLSNVRDGGSDAHLCCDRSDRHAQGLQWS
jgi:hypothetical protein